MAGQVELQELCPRQECKGPGAELQAAREQEGCCQSWVERDLGEFRKRQELGYAGHYSPGQTSGFILRVGKTLTVLSRSE